MIKAVTRKLLRSGDSRGVALSPKWLRKYNPEKLHLIYSNGLILVFTQDQLAKLDTIFDHAVAAAIRASIDTHSITKDSEPHNSTDNTPPE